MSPNPSVSSCTLKSPRISWDPIPVTPTTTDSDKWPPAIRLDHTLQSDVMETVTDVASGSSQELLLPDVSLIWTRASLSLSTSEPRQQVGSSVSNEHSRNPSSTPKQSRVTSPSCGSLSSGRPLLPEVLCTSCLGQRRYVHQLGTRTSPMTLGLYRRVALCAISSDPATLTDVGLAWSLHFAALSPCLHLRAIWRSR